MPDLSVTPPQVWHAPSTAPDAWEEIDPANIALPLRITMGRSNTLVQPDAPTLTFDYLDTTVPVAMGSKVRVTLDLPAHGVDTSWGDGVDAWGAQLTSWGGEDIGTIDRYLGTVTAMRAVEADGVVTGWTIEATGIAAQLGNTRVDLSRPAETDIQRIEAIAAAAGVEVEIVGNDSCNLVADNIHRDALSAMHEVCISSGGIVVQVRDGRIAYGTRSHRDIDATQTIPASTIMDEIEWLQSQTEVLNHIVVGWGYTPPSEAPPDQWDYDPSTTIANPGTGDVRFSAAVDQVAVHRVSATGQDRARWLRHLTDGSTALFQETGDADNTLLSRLSNIVDNGDWFSADLELVQQEGTGVGNNQPLTIVWSPIYQQTQNTYRDDESIAKWGFRHAEIATHLATETDVNEMGNTLLTRRRDPYWEVPGIMVQSLDSTTADYRAVNEMQIGTGLLLDIPVEPGPIGQVESWSVEGWVETWDVYNVQTMQFAVSDRQRWGAYQLNRWQGMILNPWSYYQVMTWLDQLTDQEL